jgi:hypothetical protein
MEFQRDKVRLHMCLRVCVQFSPLWWVCVLRHYTFQKAAADSDFVSAYCKGFPSRGIRLVPLQLHFVPTGILYKGRAEMACELNILLSALDCTCVLLTDALKNRANGNKLSVLASYDNGWFITLQLYQTLSITWGKFNLRGVSKFGYTSVSKWLTVITLRDVIVLERLVVARLECWNLTIIILITQSQESKRFGFNTHKCIFPNFSVEITTIKQLHNNETYRATNPALI